jgi:hypothetical protein
MTKSNRSWILRIPKGLPFMLFFGCYLVMIFIEGFLWRGVFWKHLKLQPLFFLIISFILWAQINYDFLTKGKQYDRYYIFIRKVSLVFLPLFFLGSLVLNFFKTEEMRLFILDNYRFHWFSLIDAIQSITILLIFFCLLDPLLLKRIRMKRNFETVTIRFAAGTMRNERIFNLDYRLMLFYGSSLLLLFFVHLPTIFYGIVVIAISLAMVIAISLLYEKGG